EYGPVLAGLIDAGRSLGAMDLMRIEHERLAFKGGLRKIFEGVDLLIAPVQPFGNPSNAEIDAIMARPGGVDDAVRFTGPFDFSGSPTITLPGGFDSRGLPIGFQLVGRHLDEPLLVRAGHAYQGVTDWHRRHPSV